MKIQFAAFIKNRIGKDLEEPDPNNNGALKKISLADLCCAVLDQQMMQDSTDPKGKVRRWELIQAITKAERDLAPLELIESDVNLIRERLLSSAFSASVTGYAIKLLDTPALEMDDDKPKVSRVK